MNKYTLLRLSQNGVKTEHFLEMDCKYLETDEVNDFLNSDDSFTIFQNNLRSMPLNLHLSTRLRDFEVFQKLFDAFEFYVQAILEVVRGQGNVAHFDLGQ